MKITKVESKVIQIPIGMTTEDVSISRTDIQVTIVTIFTDEGIIGTGYTYSDGYGGHSIKALIDRDIAELTIGLDPNDVKSIVTKLYWEFRKIGRGVTSLAIAGFEIALYDILSKACNKPLIEMFGSYRDKVKVYSSASAHRSLPVEEHIERICELIERGYVGIKIKVARQDPKADVERVRKIREAIGYDIKLMVDANSMLSLAEAINLGKQLEPYDIFWFEEPLPDYSYDGYIRVANALNIPIAAGEKLFSFSESSEYLRRGFLTFIQTDVCRIGGINEWVKVANYAENFSIKMVPHFVSELHTQLLCTIPNALWAEDLSFFSKYLQEPLTLCDGYAYSRTKPGLGLEFEDTALKMYSVV